MQKYRMARLKQILRRSKFRRKQFQSISRLRHSRSRTARIGSEVLLTILWLILPLLPGCGAGTDQPATSQSDLSAVEETPTGNSPSSNALPPAAAKSVAPGRVIQFRGVDNDYRGSTQILPNDKLVHKKEQHE